MAHNTDIEFLKEQRRELNARHNNLMRRQEELKKENMDLKREIILLKSQVKERALILSLGKPDIVDSIKLYIEAKYTLDIEKRSRTGPIVKGRFLFYYFACRYSNLSLLEIGRKCGNYDHTSVMWGRDTIIENVKNYETWRREVYDLDQFIYKNIVNDPGESLNFVLTDKDPEPEKIEIDADSENFYHKI